MTEAIDSAERAVPGATFSNLVLLIEEDAETRVWRAHASGAGLPPTIILKTYLGGTGVLKAESDALGFLTTVSPDLAPRLYGYDRETDLLIQEDLGGPHVHHLGELLFGDDRKTALQGLTAHAHALGRLHASTAGKARAYPPVDSTIPKSRHRIHRLPSLLQALPSQMGDLIGPLPDGFEAEVESHLARLRSPGAWHALGHGDATPANAFLMPDGTARLFDFETAGFRHALLDGSFSIVRYLHSVWACELPRSLRWELAECYRQTLREGVVEARTDQEFGQAQLAASTAWLAGLLGFYEEAQASDRVWGETSLRPRIVTGLAHYADIAETLGDGQAIAEAVSALYIHLVREWDDPRMPAYPAIGR